MNLKIDVLGTKYSIKYKTEDKDCKLKECDGYCDTSVKSIVVLDMETVRDKGSIEDLLSYQKKVTRHEIIHAFMYESGLSVNWKHDGWGQEETTVDWIAIQFPKLYKAFKDADCL